MAMLYIKLYTLTITNHIIYNIIDNLGAASDILGFNTNSATSQLSELGKYI